MPSRTNPPANRPVLVALCLMALTFVVALICTATAHAAEYKSVLCAADNGSNSYGTSTNSPNFTIENYCGPAPDPAGGAAFLRIAETQPSGSMAQNAYAFAHYDSPPWVHFRTAGAYTREPESFNDGWRARFWVTGGSAGERQVFIQGAGLPNAGEQAVSWPTFGPHLWQVGGYLDFTRFVYELKCVRPAGCDRAGFNAVDANTFNFVLSDEFPSQVSLTSTGDPFMDGAWVKGTHGIAYTWTERGSGMRFERVYIDNALFNATEQNCNLGWSPVSGEFARVFQPCPAAENLTRHYPLDTWNLPDGAHWLVACTQDYAQAQGLGGSGGQSCDGRVVRTDNAVPGAPSNLTVTSANPNRYLDHFGAQFALPPNQGSPIVKVHTQVINAAGEAVMPEQVYSATNPTAVPSIEGPAKPGDYSLRVRLEDEVGFIGAASVASIPRDTVPPSAPQGIAVAAPSTSRAAEGFDLRWHNIVDAGSPIDSARYQVLDGAGKVVVPTTAVTGENIEAVRDLDTPSAAGSYQLRLWLSDAEGNVGAPTTAPLAYDCPRAGAAGATQLSAGLDGRGEVTLQQGQGSTLTGSLRSQSGPVATASVCVYSRVETDAGREFLGIAVTDPAGGYRFPVPAGPSREVIAIHRPDQRQLRASAMLRTVVHPTLRARATVVRNGDSAYFEGEIPGPHNDNVTIVLQVKSGKGWLAFRRYRTRSDGHFELTYPFRRTTRPTEYEFRAQIREAGSYPYIEGDSDPLVLRVVPGRAKGTAGRKATRRPRCGKRAQGTPRRPPKRCQKKKRAQGRSVHEGER